MMTKHYIFAADMNSKFTTYTFLNHGFKNAVNRPIENAFGIGPIYQPIH